MSEVSLISAVFQSLKYIFFNQNLYLHPHLHHETTTLSQERTRTMCLFSTWVWVPTMRFLTSWSKRHPVASPCRPPLCPRLRCAPSVWTHRTRLRNGSGTSPGTTTWWRLTTRWRPSQTRSLAASEDHQGACVCLSVCLGMTDGGQVRQGA